MQRLTALSSRLLRSALGLALLSQVGLAQIQWSWSFGGEAGTFTTDGSLVGGAAPAGLYNVLDFAVTQSFDAGNLGAMSTGELDEGSQPGTGFTWDGANDTQWFRAAGIYTNGANYYSNVTQHRYLFFPGLYRVYDANDTPLVNDSVLVLTPGGAVGGGAYCFGDGSAAACPCGNAGATGEGCANSTGAGARLSASGSASVATDDLAFAAPGLISGQSALLFVGNNAVGAGQGTLFGDGLRCAGGGVVRLGVKLPDASGDAAWGPGLAPAGGWLAGDTRYFQVWYRDPLGSPCGSAFNLTHGVERVFQP